MGIGRGKWGIGKGEVWPHGNITAGCVYGFYRDNVYTHKCVVLCLVWQMQNVNVFKINEGVTRELRFEMVPEHQLTRLTGEQEQLIIQQLVKPIKFRYQLLLLDVRSNFIICTHDDGSQVHRVFSGANVSVCLSVCLFVCLSVC